jgi:hypothetical protein
VIVVADTSGIIAASDRNARESAACREILQEAGTVIISPLVLTEVDHLAKARFGSQSTSGSPPSTGPTQCSHSTGATSARCAPSLRTSGSGSCPTISSISGSSGRPSRDMVKGLLLLL